MLYTVKKDCKNPKITFYRIEAINNRRDTNKFTEIFVSEHKTFL